MKTNKLFKANKLTLAIRAAMSPQALTGAALVLAASQSDAAVIPVTKACTLVRAIVAANNDTTATGHCRKGLGPDTIVLPRNSVHTLAAINNTNYGPAHYSYADHDSGQWQQDSAGKDRTEVSDNVSGEDRQVDTAESYCDWKDR